MDWFRSWHGAPTDNKWRVIAKKAGVLPGVVSAIVWALFDHASQQEDRGSIAGFDYETYSEFSGFDVTQCHAVSQALCDKGLIHNQKFISWEKRQIKKEDKTASERKRNQRLRDKSRSVTPDVTLGHGREEKNRVEEIRVEKESTPTQPVVNKPPLPPKAPIPSSSSSPATFTGGFKKLDGVLGKMGSGQEIYDIESRLGDYELREMLAICPGWDRKELFRQYNEWVAKKGAPRSPRAAFLAWCKKKPRNP